MTRKILRFIVENCRSGLSLFRRIEPVIVFLTVLLTWIGLIIGLQQLVDLRISTSAQLMVSLEDQLTKPANEQIIQAVDENKPILIEHGGVVSDYQLDDFLGIYEIMNNANSNVLISKDMLCDAFSYDIEKTHGNAEIQNYLKDIRKEEPDLLSGYDDLARTVTQKCK